MKKFLGALVSFFLFMVAFSSGCGEANDDAAAGSHTPKCKAGGKACEAFSECCSGTCANQVCTSCAGSGEACGSGCCEGLSCGNGFCGPQCSLDGSSCTLASDCCSNVCDAGLCAGSCTALGQGCTASNQCCAGTCNGGVCSNSSCIPDNGSCTANEECCAGSCNGGVCGGATCQPDGNPCVEGPDCCQGVCSDGVCGSCASSTPCWSWLYNGNYASLCGSHAALAGEVIDCICSTCAPFCGDASCKSQLTEQNTGLGDQCSNCAYQSCGNLVNQCLSD